MKDRIISALVERLVPDEVPAAIDGGQRKLIAFDRSRPKAAVSEPAGPILQPVLSATPWDWPVVQQFYTSRKQWSFCDAMPESGDAGATYIPGLDSFTRNYRAVLELIDPDRFPGDMLTAARDAVREPTGSPIDTGASPGWTKVRNAAGQIVWRLIWTVSSTPDDWVAESSGARVSYDLNDPDQAPTRRVLTSGETALQAEQADGTRVDLATHDMDDFSVAVEGSGMVTIQPGVWYDSSVIRLARKGSSFRHGFGKNDVFGPGGLLARRSCGFLVGSNPTMSWTSSDPVHPELMQASSVSAAGLTLANDDGTPVVDSASGGGVTEYSVRPKYTKLYILAVAVEQI